MTQLLPKFYIRMFVPMVPVARTVFQILIALIVVGHSSVAYCQDDDPFEKKSGTGGAEWGNNEGSDWKAGVATIKKSSKITSGGIGCPVIMASGGVFSTDFEDGSTTQIGNLKLDIRSSTLTALANDGSHFAMANKTHNKDDTSVEVYDLKTGKKTCTIPGVEDEILDVLLITRGKYVATAGRSQPVIKVWNGVTGKLVKEFKLPERVRLDQGNVAFTNDGKYMAVVQREKLVVLQVSSEKVVATMEAPREVDRDGKVTRRISSPSSIYSSIQDLKFSPDGTELAAVAAVFDARLLCWNKNAKLVVNRPFSTTQRKVSWENDIQWMPDGQAWLVGGNLVDRSTGRVLLAFEEKFAVDTPMYVHDQNTIMGRLGSKPDQISRIEIPWKEIDRAREAIANKEPALIAPYQPVDIRCEFAGDAQKAVVEALQKRLDRDGIVYEAGATSYFKLRLSEKKGDTLPIYQRNSRFDFRGSDTGKTMTERMGSLVIEFFANDAKEPVWRRVVDAKSSRSFKEDINDRSVRKSMLERLSRDLGKMHLPYFMPVDKDMQSLPVIIE